MVNLMVVVKVMDNKHSVANTTGKQRNWATFTLFWPTKTTNKQVVRRGLAKDQLYTYLYGFDLRRGLAILFCFVGNTE